VTKADRGDTSDDEGDDNRDDRVVATDVADGVIVEELASGDAVVRFDPELRARVERELAPGETVDEVLLDAIQAFASGEVDVEQSRRF
jgi:hypothetical protein